MLERDLYLVMVLEDLGRPVTLPEFVGILKDLNVPTTSKQVSNWLQIPIKAGYVERSGFPGGFRYDKTEGYKYSVTDAGKNFVKKELTLANDILVESTPEPGVMDATKDKESTKGKKEPSLARLASGSFLICLSLLVFCAGVDPGFRKLFESWWAKQVGGQKPKEIPPETPSGLTV